MSVCSLDSQRRTRPLCCQWSCLQAATNPLLACTWQPLATGHFRPLAARGRSGDRFGRMGPVVLCACVATAFVSRENHNNNDGSSLILQPLVALSLFSPRYYYQISLTVSLCAIAI